MSRGIVTCAGGDQYFLCAYVLCRLLRDHGCTLPIEWYYCGAHEMSPVKIAEVEKIPGVKCVNLGGTPGDKTKSRGGWQAKVEAVNNSSFDEVLWLDSDCYPRKDPTFLFDHPFYTECGCALWPDIGDWEPDRKLFLERKYGITLPSGRQIESGMLIVDKRRCAEGLKRVCALNRNWQDTYQVVYGDKDTWLIGMLQAGVPVRVNPHVPGPLPWGLCQHDFDGNRFFCHMTGGKLAWHGRLLISYEDLPRPATYGKMIRELKQRVERTAT